MGPENFDLLGRYPHRDGPRGSRLAAIGPLQVEAHPDGLLCVEARASAMRSVAGVEDDHSTVAAAELSAVSEGVAAYLGDHGFDVESDARVGRCDLALDLPFTDPREGQAFLQAASYCDLPWLKSATEGTKRGGVESVTWRTVNGRSVQLRGYDKGVESGLAAPGTWLRLERQIRWRREREGRVSTLASVDASDLFARRYVAGLMLAPEVVVCDRSSAVERLTRLFRGGDLHPRRYANLVALVTAGDDGVARSTAYRHWAQLRELGIALDLHEGDGRNVVSFADYLGARLGRAA